MNVIFVRALDQLCRNTVDSQHTTPGYVILQVTVLRTWGGGQSIVDRPIKPWKNAGNVC